jgi:hypothetical protein
VTGLAAPSPEIVRARLLWEEEISKQCASAPTLPVAARQLMLAALESILAESTDPAFRRAAQPLLAALEQPAPRVAVEAAA